MELDPTWEQRLEQLWQDLGPTMRARIEALMECTGQSRLEIIRATLDRITQAKNDPDRDAGQDFERGRRPSGKDPLLE